MDQRNLQMERYRTYLEKIKGNGQKAGLSPFFNMEGIASACCNVPGQGTLDQMTENKKVFQRKRETTLMRYIIVDIILESHIELKLFFILSNQDLVPLPEHS